MSINTFLLLFQKTMCGKNRLKAETQLTLTCATLVTYCFIFSASNMTYHDPRQSVFQQDSRSGLVTQIHPFSACVSDSTILHVGNQNTWRKPKPTEETCKPHARTRTRDLLGGKRQRYLSSHHNWKILGSNSLPCIAPLSKTHNLRLLKASHACIKFIVIHIGLKYLQMTNNQT